MDMTPREAFEYLRASVSGCANPSCYVCERQKEAATVVSQALAAHATAAVILNFSHADPAEQLAALRAVFELATPDQLK
jgi:PIN domain nuclease of toxin-antitoxin system